VLALPVPHSDERRLALVLAGLAVACMIFLTEFPFGGLIEVGAMAAASLARLNLLSATMLTAFIASGLSDALVSSEATRQ
jgi:hypothetical protein